VDFGIFDLFFLTGFTGLTGYFFGLPDESQK
jgi:hypothetical protein